jgi:hypothetical protein
VVHAQTVLRQASTVDADPIFAQYLANLRAYGAGGAIQAAIVNSGVSTGC